MINIPKPRIHHGVYIFIAISLTLSSCSNSHKGWVRYNDQIDLLSASDKPLFNQSLQDALEHGPANSKVSWKNASGLEMGVIKPVRTLKRNSGIFCRIFEVSFSSSIDSEPMKAAACRNSKGTWDAVSPAKIGYRVS